MPGSPLEVLRVFLKLGLTSFGGPIAHLGYFREEFVVRRRWTDEACFTDLVALCQFLPGPASSQVAFALGLGRAGWAGGAAAWAAFTLPSAVALFLFAEGAAALNGRWGGAMLHGLKLVAVAIIAQAVWGMARALCPDRQRAAIALAGALIILTGFSSLNQIATILLGGLAGLLFCRTAERPIAGRLTIHLSKRAGIVCLALFALLIALLPFGARSHPLALFNAFYRSGALVFGGGHVVLPLLREAVVNPGWVGNDVFLAGYGAAQAVPGPLFTFAAYLGAVASPVPGLAGACIALLAIFLPGILILAGTLPFWESFRQRVWAQSAMRGVNAAVVGLLGAALFDPVWTSTMHTHADFAVALACFVLLVAWRVAPIFIVALGAFSGLVLAAFGGM